MHLYKSLRTMRRDFFVCSHCKQNASETLLFAPRTNDTEVSAQVDGNAFHQCLESISLHSHQFYAQIKMKSFI